MKYILLGLLTVLIVSKQPCGPNEKQVINSPGLCDCQPLFARLDGQNCLKCAQNGHFDTGTNKCVCNFDFKPFYDLCVKQCPPYSRQYENKKSCYCPFPWRYSQQKKSCYCPSPWRYNSHSKKCEPKRI